MNKKDEFLAWQRFLNLGKILCFVLLLVCICGCQSNEGSKKSGKKTNPFSAKERKLSEIDSQISKLYEEADKASRNGRVHDVRRAYEKVLVIYEENRETEGFKREVEPYCRLGMILEGFGQYDEAEKYYRQAMEVNPKSPVPVNSLGYCYMNQQRLDDAISYFEKAVELAPMEPKFNNNLGLAYGMKKDYDKAFQCFRRVTNEADAYYNMSGVYAMNEEEEKAKDCLLRAVQIDPTHREAKRMLTAYSEYEQNPEEFSKPLLSGNYPGSSIPFQDSQPMNSDGTLGHGAAAGEPANPMPANYTRQYGSIHQGTVTPQ